jgi:hypothetical protein
MSTLVHPKLVKTVHVRNKKETAAAHNRMSLSVWPSGYGHRLTHERAWVQEQASSTQASWLPSLIGRKMSSN